MQAKCFDVVYGWRLFGTFFVVVTCINTIIQMATYYDEPHSWFTVLNAVEAVFVVIYAIELVLKVGAEKNLRYVIFPYLSVQSVQVTGCYALYAWSLLFEVTFLLLCTTCVTLELDLKGMGS